MIVIATLAGVMGLLMNFGELTPTIVFFAALVVEFSFFAFLLSRRRRDHGNSR